MSRLPLLPPSMLDGEQEAYYKEVTQVIEQVFGNNFTTKNEDGALVGPFGVMLQTPALGRPFFALVTAFAKLPTPSLPAAAKETAILAVGAHFRARYELYAHAHIAGNSGVLTGQQIASAARGVKPNGLGPECEVAHEVANALVRGKGSLDAGLWAKATEVLGQEGVAVLVQIVGLYTYTCVMLNAWDARVPGEGEFHGERRRSSV